MRAILVAAALAAVCTPALAHAFLDHASPAAGETVHAAPRRVALHFTEALEPAFSGVAITDAAGHEMSAGTAAIGGAEMDVALKPLAPGRYRVTWHAVSVDTHRTDGKYSFTVDP